MSGDEKSAVWSTYTRCSWGSTKIFFRLERFQVILQHQSKLDDKSNFWIMSGIKFTLIWLSVRFRATIYIHSKYDYRRSFNLYKAAGADTCLQQANSSNQGPQTFHETSIVMRACIECHCLHCSLIALPVLAPNHLFRSSCAGQTTNNQVKRLLKSTLAQRKTLIMFSPYHYRFKKQGNISQYVSISSLVPVKQFNLLFRTI